MSESGLSECARIVRILASHYGRIPWWPGDPDEVLIGAILTQQTRWENVRQALLVLKERGLCSLFSIYGADPPAIEDAIRCTGFYRVKTKRLKALAMHVIGHYGDTGRMGKYSTTDLREGLLSIPGIGAETADSILCYGFNRPSFVVDAYTHRICRCNGIDVEGAHLKALFEQVLPFNNEEYRQVHAHIVEFAKEFCGKKRCGECLLKNSNI
jgi:endonuclease III related protein